MKKICAFIIIIFLQCLMALAAQADGSFYKELRGNIEIPTGEYDWNGAYIGLNTGAGIPLNPSDKLQPFGLFPSSSYRLSPGNGENIGMVGGIQAGYNWQIGRIVYGAETDFNYLGGRGGKNGFFQAPNSYLPMGDGAYTIFYNESANYFGSLRARLGITFDRLLFYATAGSATGGTRGSATLRLLPSSWTLPYTAPQSGTTHAKYITGLGLEYAFTDQVSARFEYMFLNQSFSNQYFTNAQSNIFYVSRIHNENNVFRFGVNKLLGDENIAKKTRYYGPDEESEEKLYSFHILETNVVQGYPKFYAKYSGTNSFPPSGEVRNGSTTDLFAGLRLWPGASIYVNPEVNAGYAVGTGVGNVVGAAMYPNSAFTRGTSGAPYLRFMRYFLRQSIGLGGGSEAAQTDSGVRSVLLEDTEGQVARRVDKNRLVFTIGKYAVNDIFDANKYAHDPTRDFLNFSFSNALASFDYASDTWGYTYGATAEWIQNWWTIRAGVFQLPEVPGGQKIEPVVCLQCMAVAEAEARYDIFKRPGVLKIRGYSDNGYIADINQINKIAYATDTFPPNPAWLRNKHTKPGMGLSIAQELYPDIGFFLRAGMTNGKYESISYTDVDKNIAGGFVFSGNLWNRPKDEIGTGYAIAALSGSRATYFSLGGLGLQIGDGALTYGNERVLETYYRASLKDWLETSFDYQLITNPGYNQVRGPINFFAIRMRASF